MDVLTGIKHWIPDHAHRLARNRLRLGEGARAENASVFHFHLDRTVFWSVVGTEVHEVSHLSLTNNRQG